MSKPGVISLSAKAFSPSNSTSKVAQFLTTIFGSIYHDRKQPPLNLDADDLRLEGLIHAMAGGVFLIGNGGSVLVSAEGWGS
jgi:hypothetical protein